MKILISAHKPIDWVKSELLVPIQVGCALPGRTHLEGYLYDDEGENISALNAQYCELTAQYWAWKHLEEDYIGFFHYRRYLAFKEGDILDDYGDIYEPCIRQELSDVYGWDDETMRAVIGQYDLIVPTRKNILELPHMGRTLEEQFGIAGLLHQKDMDIMQEVIRDRYPEFVPYMTAYLEGHYSRFCNMYIMKGELFSDYAAWLFDVLEECVKRGNYEGYSTEAMRTPGHLAERLFNIYLAWLMDHRELRMLELPMVLFRNTDPAGTSAATESQSEESPAAGGISGKLNKVRGYMSDNGLKKTLKQIYKKTTHYDERRYHRWQENHEAKVSRLTWQMVEEPVVHDAPVISIVVPLYKTPMQYLTALIDSVRHQTADNWELCFSDGSGADSPLRAYLTELSANNSRIKAVFHDTPLRIAENTNAAIELAAGEFIAFADHDDILSPDAVSAVTSAIELHPEAEVFYSDEDKISANGQHRFDPHFKTEYNPEMLCSVNYMSHLTVIKASLLDKTGLLDPAYDGAQDYDLILRACEQAAGIVHIPKVLYHWRAHEASTAENPASKRYAYIAGQHAIEAHYERTGIPAGVVSGPVPGTYRTFHRWAEKPLVSVIILNKDHKADLEKCIASLDKSFYRNYEILVMENGSTEPDIFKYYEELGDRIRLLKWEEPFNFAAMNNAAAKEARGEYLLFLNNDTEMCDTDGIDELLGYAMRPGVGAVGAKLVYPDGTLQHAGVIIGFGGFAGHAFIGMPESAPGYFGRAQIAQNLSAVTGACLMVKKQIFEEISGFDETYRVSLNDIDLCLRICEAGYRVVYNPYAVFIHAESKSRGAEDTREKRDRFAGEIKQFRDRWEMILKDGDPYYSPNLSLRLCDFGPAD